MGGCVNWVETNAIQRTLPTGSIRCRLFSSRSCPQINHPLPRHTPSRKTRPVFECIVEDPNACRGQKLRSPV
jgi:hypothetical protein